MLSRQRGSEPGSSSTSITADQPRQKPGTKIYRPITNPTIPDSPNQNQRSKPAPTGQGEPRISQCAMIRKMLAATNLRRLTTNDPTSLPAMVNKAEFIAKVIEVTIAAISPRYNIFPYNPYIYSNLQLYRIVDNCWIANLIIPAC